MGDLPPSAGARFLGLVTLGDSEYYTWGPPSDGWSPLQVTWYTTDPTGWAQHYGVVVEAFWLETMGQPRTHLVREHDSLGNPLWKIRIPRDALLEA